MKLRTVGLKARDLDIDLGGKNILVGPNGSGKSTASDAIRFLALGYVPALGKRPVDTAALMGGEKMTVALMMDNGRVIQRELGREGDALKSDIEVSWLKKAKTVEASKEILGLFGTEEADAAECLDIRTLLTAKPNERAARIEQMMAASGPDAEERAQAIARFTVQRLIGIDESRMPKKLKDALPMLADSQRGILKSSSGQIRGKIAEGGFAAAIDWANGEKREASTGLRRLQSARKELDKRLAGRVEPSAERIKELDDERSTIEQELGGLEQAIQTFEIRKDSFNSSHGTLKQRTDHRDQMRVHLQQILEHGPKQLKPLRDEFDTHEATLEEMITPVRQDSPKAQQLKEEVEALEEKLSAFTLPEVPSTAAEVSAYEAAKAVLESLKASPWSEVLEISDRLLKDVRGKIMEGVKRIKAIAKKRAGGSVDEGEKTVAQAKKRLEAIDKRHGAAVEKRNEAIKERQGLIDEKDAKAKQAMTELDKTLETLDAQLKAYREKRTAIEEKKVEVHRKIGEMERSIENAKKQSELNDLEVQSARKIAAKFKNPGKPPKAPDEVRTRLADVKLLLKVATEEAAAFKEINSIIASIDKYEAESAVFAALEWSMQKVRADELSDSGGKLLRFMTEFLKAAGRPETPFIRAGQGLCSVGWKRPDGREVQSPVLSGGEWVLFAAALTSSVILIRRASLKILLIEAGETDAHTLAALARGIDAIADGLTASIVMTQGKDLTVPKSWKVIRTDQVADAAARSDTNEKGESDARRRKAGGKGKAKGKGRGKAQSRT